MIAVLPGDGIGPEVTTEAVRALKAAAAKTGATLKFEELPFGGRAIDETGVPLPAETLETCRRAHAVLMGAVGGPKWDALAPEIRPERGLLGLREGLGTFANLRPVRLPPAMNLTSPLRDDLVAGGFDVLVVRELTGGLYYGDKRRWEEGGVPRAMDVMSYTAPQVERLARVAFDLAKSRSGRLTSVDKANVLVTSRLWRDVVNAVARDYPEIQLEHMYVDNCAHLLVRDPRRFDVILTENTFGDILSDLGGGLVGSLGLLPSASLGQGGPGLYEPVHGSAPDIAGRGIANPVGAILSAAMLARFSLGRDDMADLIEDAVWRTLAVARPADLVSGGGGRSGGDTGGRSGGQNDRPVSTQDFGAAVEERITRNRHGSKSPVAEGRLQM
ncbi:MAG: 3-isopropylmalate dehydrogenase [Bacillota bacterium]